jgi:AraC-like DNA-binding protein
VIKSVAAYAQQLNITEKRLNIATSNVLGKTAKMVIDDHVVIEARRMIAFTSLSIKEIGFELGFSQTTHFIKYFTKHAGMSPATFRQQHS